jgi:hypothetical protein
MLRITDTRNASPAAHAALLLAVAVMLNVVLVTPAAAATAPLTAVGRIAAPLAAHIGSEQSAGQEQQEPEPPPFPDPINGPVLSIFGGSVFSGSSAFQTGGAFAYFFGPKASYGFEVEGSVTFGPGGRVAQGMGSFVWQTGARTSKFVPYFAVGAGYLRAKSSYPTATQEVLDEFGIDPQPKTEQGPFIQYGGGLRFYVKPSLAFRADVRFALVPLNLEVDPGLWDRLFAMRRIAGMISFDF